VIFHEGSNIIIKQCLHVFTPLEIDVIESSHWDQILTNNVWQFWV